MDISGRGFRVDYASRIRVFFGDEPAHIYRVSASRLGVQVPENAGSEVRVCLNDRETEPYPISIGRFVAEKLHIVSNPVFDSEGFLYTTVSGTRGEKIPHPVYRLADDEDPVPMGDGIVNPTGLAWGPDDTLYVSSRQDGHIYRMNEDGDFDVLLENLGVATGIGFSPTGDLMVGDRNGVVYRMAPDGDVSVFSQMRPSVSAYHLAFNSAGSLFVSGPTLASRDHIVEFEPDGEVRRLLSGFGRPQGMAFDHRDRCFIAEGLAGDGGVFLFTAERTTRRIISGPSMVGVAIRPDEGVIAVATGEAVYAFDLDSELLGESEEEGSGVG